MLETEAGFAAEKMLLDRFQMVAHGFLCATHVAVPDGIHAFAMLLDVVSLTFTCQRRLLQPPPTTCPRAGWSWPSATPSEGHCAKTRRWFRGGYHPTVRRSGNRWGRRAFVEATLELRDIVGGRPQSRQTGHLGLEDKTRLHDLRRIGRLHQKRQGRSIRCRRTADESALPDVAPDPPLGLEQGPGPGATCRAWFRVPRPNDVREEGGTVPGTAPSRAVPSNDREGRLYRPYPILPIRQLVRQTKPFCHLVTSADRRSWVTLANDQPVFCHINAQAATSIVGRGARQ